MMSTIEKCLSRFRFRKDGGMPFRWRYDAEEDPLAPLVETARRLQYGAGRFVEPGDEDT